MRRLARRLFTLCSAVSLVLVLFGCAPRRVASPRIEPLPATQPVPATVVTQPSPLLRIAELQRSLPPVARSKLVASATHLSAAAELVDYLHDPDPEVRKAAYHALISFQPDCPPPEVEVWEAWLRQLQEDGAGD